MFGDTVEMQSQTAATAPTQSWWAKTVDNIGNALATTIGTLTPVAVSLIQQKTAEKLGQAQVYQMQMTPAQNSPAAVPPPSAAKKLPSWVVPGAVGGALLIGGLLLMRKKR